MQIWIKQMNGDVLTIETEGSDTLGNIKNKIEKQSDIPVSRQRLIFVGRELGDDDKTVSEMGIEDSSTFHLVLRDVPKGEDLFVRTLTGKVLHVKFASVTYVDDLKDKIEESEGIPNDQQRLIFAGKQMEDGRPLSDYGLFAGASVHLVLRLRGQGDVLQNHVESTVPQDDEKDVSLTTSLSFTLDSNVSEVHENMLTLRTETGDFVSGISSYDKFSHTVSFVPENALSPCTTYILIGNNDKWDNNNNDIIHGNSYDYEIQFTTETFKLSCAVSHDDLVQELSFICENGDSMLTDFKQAVCESFNKNIDDLESIKTLGSSTNNEIDIVDADDIVNLTNDDTLVITFKE